jgi:hypothetical protein
MRHAQIVVLSLACIITFLSVTSALEQHWNDESTDDNENVKVSISDKEDGYFVFVHIMKKCDDLDYSMLLVMKYCRINYALFSPVLPIIFAGSTFGVFRGARRHSIVER